MEITNELMQRFFANECDPEEFEAVIEHLRLHPAERERFLGMAEWNAIPSERPAPDQVEALAKLRQRLFGNVGEEPLGPRASVPLIRRLRWTSVAASLLLALGGWLWMKNKKEPAAVAATGQSGTNRQTVWISKNNTSGRTERVVLPDGSLVKLYAHATLRYTDSFGISARESWLEGQAEFEVRKDKAHAFTVYAGKLATTALGTTFGVKAATDALVQVKLFTGKVVVREIGRLPGWKKDVYLLPGQELVYDSRRMLATVSRYATAPGAGPGAEPAATAGDAGDLNFNNTPLKKVFHDLSAQYHTTINFNPKDLTGMNFTGSVSRQDSLATVVRLLATMNGLDIREEPDGIKVTRQKN